MAHARTQSYNGIASRAALALLLSLGCYTPASGHCIVGNRFFPATLNVDDPCVADELSMPTIAGFKNGDDPSARELDISGEYSKTITENFGVSFEEAWIHLDIPHEGSAQGFDNLGTSFKYQFVRNAGAERAMSISLDVDWGGTGSKAVDAEPFTTLVPTFFVGQGFGFMPKSMRLLKPFAVAAQLGYAIPTKSSVMKKIKRRGCCSARQFRGPSIWAARSKYSMPYLKSSVQDLGLPAFVNRMIPIVEWNLSTETSNFSGEERTTGTINPGVIYVADKYQLGVEAIIPVNRASGDNVGVMGQLHLYLDDIFPHSIGKPLFGPTSAAEGVGY